MPKDGYIVVSYQRRNASFFDNATGQKQADKLIADLQARGVPFRMERVNGKAKSKMGNQRCQEGELTFDSKWERSRWRTLKALEQAGKISKLRRQRRYKWRTTYEANGKQWRNPRVHCYVADFVYIENGVEVVEDAKGFLTKAYRQKRRIMKELFGITIRETFQRKPKAKRKPKPKPK